MSRTANTVKDRWNAKNYDDLRIRVPKGRKKDIEAYAKKQNMSINGLINNYLSTVLGMTEDEWKDTPRGT